MYSYTGASWLVVIYVKVETGTGHSAYLSIVTHFNFSLGHMGDRVLTYTEMYGNSAETS